MSMHVQKENDVVASRRSRRSRIVCASLFRQIRRSICFSLSDCVALRLRQYVVHTRTPKHATSAVRLLRQIVFFFFSFFDIVVDALRVLCVCSLSLQFTRDRPNMNVR